VVRVAFGEDKGCEKTGVMVAAMGVNATHGDYDAMASQWSRARDVLSGEDAVKAAGERYLPRLDSQSDAEFAAYMARASFFGATARTLEEYLDLVFRHAPTLRVGEDKALDAFAVDCDLWGLEFLRYARHVVGEILSVGRGGSLVLWDASSARPWASFWRAEDVINWKVERVGDVATLIELALRDGSGIRLLRLVDSVCVQEVWKPSADTLVLEQRVTLRRGDAVLPFIPFVFHGPKHSRPEVERLPLADIIAANLDHYRLDADLKHGLHFAALPTAWVSGFEKTATLRIGSSAAWVSDASDASAGFLEFSGAGLAHIEQAMEKVERRMVLLGARMLEAAGVPVTGQPMAAESAELCGLGSIVASLNQSLTRVLQLAHWWLRGGAVGDTAGVGLALNTDLSARRLTADEILAVVEAWKSGGISRDSMLDALKRGEILPEGRTVAQEKALIHGKAGVAA
jgi:hypothetical protein